MEPNKLEQDIKQKLDARSINPSPMAWDRLDAMLTVAEQKAAPQKKKPIVMWLSMAAGFAALLIGGLWYLNTSAPQNTNSIINNGATVTESSKPATATETQDADTVTNEILTVSPQNNTVAEVNTTAKSNSKKANKTVTTKAVTNLGFPQAQAPENLVAQNTAATQGANEVNNPPATATTTKTPKIRVDAGALLASVDQSAKNNAPRNIASKNPMVKSPGINQPKVQVNANSLLASVEGELDNSFRGKVFNSIEKNYSAVKHAVVTRNLQ